MTDSPFPDVPAIRIELLDGTNSWVTHMPITGRYLNDALSTAGEVFTWFVRNLVVDQDAVERHLREFSRGESHGSSRDWPVTDHAKVTTGGG